MPRIYWTNSNLPKRFLAEQSLVPYECDLQSYTRLNNIKLDIANFVKDGLNLIIYSKITGNGKTSWATKLLKAYLEYAENFSFKADCPAYFINVTRLLDLKKSSMSDYEISIKQIEEYIRCANLVVWDDIAVRGLSDYDKEYLYALVDFRVGSGKSNIFTSNLTPAELEVVLGARLYSRVVNTSVTVEFFGSDRRVAY